MSDQAFVFHDGQRASTPQELLHVLKHIEPSLASRHIAEGRNDYANWIQGVFHDDKLAAAVRSCQTVSEVIDVLRHHLRTEPAPPAEHHERQAPAAPAHKPHQMPPHRRPAPPDPKPRPRPPEPKPREETVKESPAPATRAPESPPTRPEPARVEQRPEPHASGHPPAVEEQEELKKDWTPSKRRSPIGWDKPLRTDPIRELARKGLREHPHVREFVIGLAIGILIGALATILAT